VFQQRVNSPPGPRRTKQTRQQPEKSPCRIERRATLAGGGLTADEPDAVRDLDAAEGLDLSEARLRPGQASQTAVYVCMGRALAHGRSDVGSFSDPTALLLLPERERANVELLRSGQLAAGLRERWRRAESESRAMLMVARTISIDAAVRVAGSSQVVILGAGLDGRAWRMPELAGATVFEVDHPDSQRDKRARVGALRQVARVVRFVAVDFTRDDLGSALDAAGHDPQLPTTWVWEGVVMYLTLAEIEATLAVLERRSAPGSSLILVYHRRALSRLIVGLMMKRMGEPFRSVFDPASMRALLQRRGFRVVRDEGIPTIGASISPSARAGTRFLRHVRIAVAERDAGR
jgi:methyltransferase (TIGR00027 family)